MRDEMLEKILACPSLPSLPAVALRVIELAGNPDVVMKELASTIEKDQGLASKVLRTVNSSFYAVRTRCGTISKALVLMGLGPVKALTLGFSLVSAVSDESDTVFDFKAYWRRGLYTAVSAKVLAEAAGLQCGEEAFLGGLLQDVGMVAMRRALGREYLDVLASSKGDHRALVKHELDAFDLNHADIGAMLAKRWKFPDELTLPVKYHERPTAAPKDCTEIVRLVGLGNMAHDALTDPNPADAMRKLYQRNEEWLKLAPTKTDEAMRRIAEAVREMSSLFSLDTGSAADVDQVLKKAQSQLTQLSKAPPAAAPAGSGLASILSDGGQFDPLTGVLTKRGFDGALRQAFAAAAKDNESVTLVQVSVEGLKPVMDSEVGDDVVIGIATLMKKHFEPAGGVVCRLTGEIFAAVVAGGTSAGTLAAAEEFCGDVKRTRPTWTAGVPNAVPPPVTVSLGLASREPGTTSFEKPEQLVIAATQAVQTARHGGGNRASVFTPKKAA